MIKKSILLLSLFSCGFAYAQDNAVGDYYVNEITLESRLAPSMNVEPKGVYYRKHKLHVHEVAGDWARVSSFYDGSIDGIMGQVAKWVPLKGLSKKMPENLVQPAIYHDPRISKKAFPPAGEFGMTAKDLRVLHAGSAIYLSSGKCDQVKYGDKHHTLPNVYFVNCGGKNINFTLNDLEDYGKKEDSDQVAAK